MDRRGDTEMPRGKRVVFEAFGETKAIKAWAQDPRCRVSEASLWQRLAKGWNLEQALTFRTDDDRLVEAFGESKTVAQWARDPRCRVSDPAIRQRLALGWPLERALTVRLDENPRPEAFGERKSLQAWALDPRCVVSLTALQRRLYAGEPLEEALTRKPEFQHTNGPHDDRLWPAFGEEKTCAQWALDPRCKVGRVALARRLDAGMDPESAIAGLREKPPVEYEAFGSSDTLWGWAKDPRCLVTEETLRSRVRNGDSVEEAMTRPPRSRPHRPKGLAFWDVDSLRG